MWKEIAGRLDVLFLLRKQYRKFRNRKKGSAWLSITFRQKKIMGAIGIGVVGIFFWILMALAVPLDKYEANLFWESERYVIYWLIGYVALCFSNAILKKYQKLQVLGETEKKCYKVLRICWWLAWLIPAYVIFVLGK